MRNAGARDGRTSGRPKKWELVSPNPEEPAGQRAKQHIVSAGYQRMFAAGKQILYMDKSTSTGKSVGVRDAFMEQHFNSWSPMEVVPLFGDSAGPCLQPVREIGVERHWAVIESQVIPALIRLENEVAEREDRWRAAQLAALHIARSFAFQERYDAMAPTILRFATTSIFAVPSFRRLFRNQYGRDPDLRDSISIARMFHDSRVLFGEWMRQQFLLIQDHFWNMRLYIMSCPPGHSYGFGDTPVLYSSADGQRIGMRQGVLLGEAREFVMPISRTKALLISYSPYLRDFVLCPDRCRMQNLQQWRAARRFVACHPDDDPTSLYGRPIKITSR